MRDLILSSPVSVTQIFVAKSGGGLGVFSAQRNAFTWKTLALGLCIHFWTVVPVQATKSHMVENSSKNNEKSERPSRGACCPMPGCKPILYEHL